MKQSPVHLIVLSHGLWGEPQHLLALQTALKLSFGKHARVVHDSPSSRDSKRSHQRAEAADGGDAATNNHDEVLPKAQNVQLRLSKEDESVIAPAVVHREQDVDMDIVILNAASNAGNKTYDGLEWLGDRVVAEIRAEETRMSDQDHQYIARFSAIGYSIGGLVARYVIGALEADGFFSTKVLQDGTRRRIEARQLITIASPHVGAPPGNGGFSKIAAFFGRRLLSRTGQQIFINDGGWERQPDKGQDSAKEVQPVGLLEYMSQPESVFMRGMRRFKRVRFYANAVNDPTVPFRTGCVEEVDPFAQKLKIDIKLVSGTPIVESMQVERPPPPSFGQSVYEIVPSMPPFFNPRRLPFKFPYNYIAVGCAPLLFPFMISMVIYRLSKDSRRSQLRIKDLEKGLDPELQGAGRIDKLMNHVVQSAAEERVDGNAEHPEGDDPAREGTLQTGECDSVSLISVTEDEAGGHSTSQSYDPEKMPRSVWNSKQAESQITKTKEPSLLRPQLRMVSNLNDPANLPQLKKIWVYFPDVVNCHAMIVCRVPSMPVQRRGLPVLKHIISDFLI